MVARRQDDRLHLRRHRRGRDLRRPAGRQRQADAAHHRRPTPTSTSSLWSPDSKKILWADKKLRLQLRRCRRRRRSRWSTRRRRGRSATSPGRRTSKWIAYARPEDGRHEQGLPLLAGAGQVDARSPTAGTTSGQPVLQRRRQVPVLRLATATSTRSTARPSGTTPTATCRASTSSRWRRTRRTRSGRSSDEAERAEDDEEGRQEGREEGREEDEPPTVKVDLDGLDGPRARAAGPAGELPQPARRSAARSTTSAQASQRREPAASTSSTSARKKETVARHGQRLRDLRRRQEDARLARTASTASSTCRRRRSRIGEPLNLSGMEVQLDRQAEWKQIFHECWRQMRDFFYDPDMHGVDWKAVREEVRAAGRRTSATGPT